MEELQVLLGRKGKLEKRQAVRRGKTSAKVQSWAGAWVMRLAGPRREDLEPETWV